MSTRWRIAVAIAVAVVFASGYVLGYQAGQIAACVEACDSEEVYVPSPGECFCDGEGNTMYRGW